MMFDRDMNMTLQRMVDYPYTHLPTQPASQSAPCLASWSWSHHKKGKKKDFRTYIAEDVLRLGGMLMNGGWKVEDRNYGNGERGIITARWMMWRILHIIYWNSGKVYLISIKRHHIRFYVVHYNPNNLYFSINFGYFLSFYDFHEHTHTLSPTLTVLMGPS